MPGQNDLFGVKDFKGYMGKDLVLGMPGSTQTILEANENLEGHEKGTIYHKK